jgi:hypothetical protein
MPFVTSRRHSKPGLKRLVANHEARALFAVLMHGAAVVAACLAGACGGPSSGLDSSASEVAGPEAAGAISFHLPRFLVDRGDTSAREAGVTRLPATQVFDARGALRWDAPPGATVEDVMAAAEAAR